MTTIQWTNETWNPVVGCSKVSEGCRNCYAMAQSRRQAVVADARVRKGETPSPVQRAYQAVVRRDDNGVPLPQWTNQVRTIPERLTEPMRWREPRLVFVNSMSDLFHPDVPFDFVDRVFAVMALCPRHTFQVLTKRPERMAAYTQTLQSGKRFLGDALRAMDIDGIGSRIMVAAAYGALDEDRDETPPFRAFPNVWLGTSVEDQRTADERVPLLAECPAAVRFLSCEPLLGSVLLSTLPDLGHGEFGNAIQWVIVGGESGPEARPFDPAWAEVLIEQCGLAGVDCFVKQLGRRPVGLDLDDPHGGDIDEWPERLRVREYPKAAEGVLS